MKALRSTGPFRRDFKRIARRGYDLSLFETLIDRLRNDQPLPVSARPHPLKGEWAKYMDCHIQPDWILIYQVEADEIVLARTGTHADLFG